MSEVKLTPQQRAFVRQTIVGELLNLPTGRSFQQLWRAVNEKLGYDRNDQNAPGYRATDYALQYLRRGGYAAPKRRIRNTQFWILKEVPPVNNPAIKYIPPLSGEAAKHAANINALADLCHQKSAEKGWWIDEVTGLDLSLSPYFKWVIGTKLMLMVSELSEAMEGERKGIMDDKLTHRPMGEVELADAVIRIMDTARKLGYDLGGAIMEKMAFNDVRPDHSVEARAAAGGKKF